MGGMRAADALYHRRRPCLDMLARNSANTLTALTADVATFERLSMIAENAFAVDQVRAMEQFLNENSGPKNRFGNSATGVT
jgi:hypothetical protein